MKIAVISKGDRLTGGASRVADDLARWATAFERADAAGGLTYFVPFLWAIGRRAG